MMVPQQGLSSLSRSRHCVQLALRTPRTASLRPCRRCAGKVPPADYAAAAATACAAAVSPSAVAVADGLPIQEVIPEILTALQTSSCLVLQAPPGAGKTTAVPLALLLQQPEFLNGGKRILVLEPRRVAAKAAARRMASMLRERVGATVGYRVRLESRVGPATRIEVVTEGILLRRLQQDPGLEGVGAVLLDEFHERNLDADLALALCLDTQRWTRPDLRLVVMSATLGGGLAEAVQDLMASCQDSSNSDNAGESSTAADGSSTGVRVIVSEGRSYPVKTVHLGAPIRRDGGRLERAVADAVLSALERDDGDVLAFLPGVAEIRRTQQLLREEGPRGVRVLPLHGNLAPDQQDEAIKPSSSGIRRVVLATPIAESSVTIDGVTVVVDSGLRRAPVFDEGAGFSRLQTQRISRASADQRRGRAGRTAPGVCYRLWDGDSDLPETTPPEIEEADLAPLALELAAWGDADGASLPWLDPPDHDALATARALLEDLGAVDARGAATACGRQMATLGVHPRFAHLVLRARDMGCPELGCVVASLLSERDVLRGAGGGGGGPGSADLALRLSALAGDGPPIVDRAGAQRVLQSAAQMMRQLSSASARSQQSEADAGSETEGDADEDEADESEEDTWSTADEETTVETAAANASTTTSSSSSSSSSGRGGFGSSSGGNTAAAFTEAWTKLAERKGLVGALVALAYPDRIAQRKDAGGAGGRASFVMSTGRPLRLLSPDDPLKSAPYVAVASISSGRDGRNDILSLGAALTLSAIKTHLSSEVRTVQTVFWAPAGKTVLARKQEKVGSLVLSEEAVLVEDERALPVLFKGFQDSGWAGLPIPPATEAWRHRAAWLRAAEVAATGASTLPDLSESALMASLPAWLGPYAAGIRSRAQLSKLDWGNVLRGLMNWDQLQRVETEAPSHVQLPTGSRVPIEYGPRSQPTARARLQECFGLLDTPLLGGPARVPLLLELLSPAGRPLQVTADLAAFWANSYTEVRKEMAGRYPKHVWPTDPRNAEATKFTKKQQQAQQQQGGAQQPQVGASGGQQQQSKKKRR